MLAHAELTLISDLVFRLVNDEGRVGLRVAVSNMIIVHGCTVLRLALRRRLVMRLENTRILRTHSHAILRTLLLQQHYLVHLIVPVVYLLLLLQIWPRIVLLSRAILRNVHIVLQDVYLVARAVNRPVHDLIDPSHHSQLARLVHIVEILPALVRARVGGLDILACHDPSVLKLFNRTLDPLK